MKNINPTQTSAWQALQKHFDEMKDVTIADLFAKDSDRFSKFSATFDDLIARSAEFRKFVFTAFSVRVTNLFRIIEEVAFSRIDVRLAARLLELGGGSGQVALTHQQLAAELGTAREVISRQLHEFQRRQWITTARGTIGIVDGAALRKLATAS